MVLGHFSNACMFLYAERQLTAAFENQHHFQSAHNFLFFGCSTVARIILLNYLRNNLILKFIKFILVSEREFKKLTILIYFYTEEN